MQPSLQFLKLGNLFMVSGILHLRFPVPGRSFPPCFSWFLTYLLGLSSHIHIFHLRKDVYAYTTPLASPSPINIYSLWHLPQVNYVIYVYWPSICLSQYAGNLIIRVETTSDLCNTVCITERILLVYRHPFSEILLFQ